MRRSYAGLTHPLKPPAKNGGQYGGITEQKSSDGESKLRRQTVLGGVSPAGTGRVVRLDPMALPVRFTAEDPLADGQTRQVELDRSRMLLRRSVRGMAIRLNVPLNTFVGVAVRLVSGRAPGEEKALISLEHRDPGLSIPLCTDLAYADADAEWQLWGRVLGVPLLVADMDGRLREPFARIGAVRKNAPTPRRRRRNAIRRRRPSFPLRRRGGVLAPEPIVHREREIIARN